MGQDLCMFFTGDDKTDVVWFKINYTATISSEADITGLLAEEKVNILYGYLDPKTSELGRFAVTRGFDDLGSFKTPTLTG